MARQRSLRPPRSPRPPRSLPPGAAASRFAFRQIARFHGGVESSMLDALLEEVTAERLEELRREASAEEVLASAAKALSRADQTLRETTREQRSKLRGFSPEMLALAADQAFRLGHLQEQYERVVEEEAGARAALDEAVKRAWALIDQASWVLAKVGAKPMRPASVTEQGGVATGAESAPVSETVDALARLSRAGERVVRSGNAAAKNRAILYGLDSSYLQMLGEAGAGLLDLDARIRQGDRLVAAKRALDEAHARTAFLLRQIADAFAAAHRIEPVIPELLPPARGAGHAAGGEEQPGPAANGEVRHLAGHVLGTAIPISARRRE